MLQRNCQLVSVCLLGARGLSDDHPVLFLLINIRHSYSVSSWLSLRLVCYQAAHDVLTFLNHVYIDINRSQTVRRFTGTLLNVHGFIEAHNIEGLEIAHVHNIRLLQASVISCFLFLCNSDIKLGLLRFEPSIVIEYELLHLFEKPECTTVYSLH